MEEMGEVPFAHGSHPKMPAADSTAIMLATHWRAKHMATTPTLPGWDSVDAHPTKAHTTSIPKMDSHPSLLATTAIHERTIKISGTSEQTSHTTGTKLTISMEPETDLITNGTKMELVIPHGCHSTTTIITRRALNPSIPNCSTRNQEERTLLGRPQVMPSKRNGMTNGQDGTSRLMANKDHLRSHQDDRKDLHPEALPKDPQAISRRIVRELRFLLQDTIRLSQREWGANRQTLPARRIDLEVLKQEKKQMPHSGVVSSARY